MFAVAKAFALGDFGGPVFHIRASDDELEIGSGQTPGKAAVFQHRLVFLIRRGIQNISHWQTPSSIA